ncbi:MAG: hypothetical protein A3K10_05705 [Bacteroidetes bacterium RIFCSPLOWO2_12_FULL_31_6]|nr:MAG: hypothetical protein A3K10_05705 [Bacteroidetes bacterium RIFCSPLOWO2_12_FULL_31_6]
MKDWLNKQSLVTRIVIFIIASVLTIMFFEYITSSGILKGIFGAWFYITIMIALYLKLLFKKLK